MDLHCSRRELLAGATVLAVGGAAKGDGEVERTKPKPATSFRYCLNTATLRGRKLPLVELVEIAAKAGYDGIEPWIDEIDRFAQAGGRLEELARRIKDKGLKVESAIGFSEWIVEDEARRKRGLEDARRSMDKVRRLGGERIAAPPAGWGNEPAGNPLALAERYHALLKIGDKIGVTPQLEVWGFSKVLSRLGEVAMVAMESGHPKACLLLDVYHLHKGGSDFASLRFLSGGSMHVFHLNDYAANIELTRLNDADRIYPGDGDAPIPEMLRVLASNGFAGVLSIELFNRSYWAQDPSLVATTALQKMRDCAARSRG